MSSVQTLKYQHVLVTGGSGFLGRRIVHEASQAGYSVIAPRSSEFDLETGKNVRDLFSRYRDQGSTVDCVIHSAAYYGGIGICQTDPLGLSVRNARMIATIFEEAAEARVKKIVSVGSTCAYPGLLESDMTEDLIFMGRCHPSVEAYGFSKRLQLVMMAAVHKQYGIQSVQMALTNLYGEYDVFQESRSHAVAALIKKIVDAQLSGSKVVLWGTGDPIRQFLYVGDAAKAIVGAIPFNHDDTPFNVGGTEISIKELAFMIADIVKLSPDRIVWDTNKPNGVARKVVNENKLKKMLPSHSHIPFHKGLKATISWYMSNKEKADLRS